jgi:predicted RNA binding protein YcfA (HicA-like mRNA interferase family)
MPITKLYNTWMNKITQLLPNERVTRVRNLAWLLAGIFQSKSVHLSKIASQLPGKAMLVSATRRLDRFLECSEFRVRDWYEPIVKEILAQRAGQEYRLIVDGSKVGFGHQFLVITLAYRHRAIPLVWMWVRCSRGHSTSGRQLALLNYIHKLLPKDAHVLLLGDSEFGAIEVLKQLDQWKWKYVLRQKGSHLVRENDQSPWIALGSVLAKAGESLWLGQRQLTQLHAYTTNVLAHWKLGEKEPWLLATNLPSLREALKAYALRMWIEEMFGDLKSNGFDLESTHLRSVLKLHRLTFAVVLLFLELLTSGSKIIKNGLRRLVDRSDRRDLSVFRIGLYMRERHLANSRNFVLDFYPLSYDKLSGS